MKKEGITQKIRKRFNKEIKKVLIKNKIKSITKEKSINKSNYNYYTSFNQRIESLSLTHTTHSSLPPHLLHLPLLLSLYFEVNQGGYRDYQNRGGAGDSHGNEERGRLVYRFVARQESFWKKRETIKTCAEFSGKILRIASATKKKLDHF